MSENPNYNPDAKGYHWEDEPVQVPADLVPYWRRLQGRNVGMKALVCPRCQIVFGGKLEGVWGAFRAHIAGTGPSGDGGCFFREGAQRKRESTGGRV